MTIHADHPFVPPPEERSPLRRLRGRLVAPVTLWTAWTTTELAASAGSADDAQQAAGGAMTDEQQRPGARAGLTVASVMVVDGSPGHVLGIVDPESDLLAGITQSGAAVVTLLARDDRGLADIFGYVAPAPGGPFARTAWAPTPWGPRLAAPRTWAGVRLRKTRDVGYGVLVDAAIENIEIADGAPEPLALHRGRYGTTTAQ